MKKLLTLLFLMLSLNLMAQTKLTESDLVDTLELIQSQKFDTQETERSLLLLPCLITSINSKFITYNTVNENGLTIKVSDVFNKTVNSSPYIYYDAPIYNFSNIGLAGLDLEKASTQFYTGITLLIVGSALTTIGAVLPQNQSSGESNKNTKTGLFVVGGAVATIGLVVNIASFTKIGKAGKKLQNYNRTVIYQN